jgi:ketosteroid isomerase-like protein
MGGKSGFVVRDDRFQFVRQIYETASRGLDPFLALMADEVIIEQRSAVPWGDTVRGIDEARAFLGRASEHISSSQEIEEIFDAGEDIVVIGRSRGMARKTGRPFDVRIVHAWRIENHRIARWQLFADTPPLLAATSDAE